MVSGNQIRLRSYSSSLEQLLFMIPTSAQRLGGLPWAPPHSLFFSSQHSLTPEMTLPVCFLLCASPLRIQGPWGQKPCLWFSAASPELPRTVRGIQHFVNMCRVNQWMNQGTGPGASFLEGTEKEGSPPTLVSEPWIALSELWPTEPRYTDHPEQPAVHSNDNE